MKIYVASSWRNTTQETVVMMLRQEGHDVYDFKHPTAGSNGFHWSEIDPAWQSWTPFEFIVGLRHEIAEEGFASDFDAMKWADACVLVLPCGRSAHIEAGYFVGANKPLIIMLNDGEIEPPPGHKRLGPCPACGDLDGCHAKRVRLEPELMYKMATSVVVYPIDVLRRVNELNEQAALANK